MTLEFESTPEYREKNVIFYEAIKILLQDQKSKINVNSVSKIVGYDRSAIRKDREIWLPLLRDIEIANNYQQNNAHFQLKKAKSNNRAVNNNVKEYKSKYLQILSAFYDLHRIVEDQKKTIDYLSTKIDEQTKTILDLSQENIFLKTNGKVKDIAAAKNKKK